MHCVLSLMTSCVCDRWWPGEICHPDNTPMNIQDKTHQVGEFPVRFFGTGEFAWLTQSRYVTLLCVIYGFFTKYGNVLS